VSSNSAASDRPCIPHVELMLECADFRAQAGRPILVGKLGGLLGGWLREVGIEEKPGVDWDLHVRLDPSFAFVLARFEGVLGRRMYRYLSRNVDTPWRWLPADPCPWRPDSGQAVVPVHRLWLARRRRGPTPIDPALVGGQEVIDGRQWHPYFLMAGFIAIDVSQVTGTDEAGMHRAQESIVDRLMRHPDTWSVVRPSGLECNIRLAGALADLLDSARPLDISWDAARTSQIWMNVAVPDRGRLRTVPCSIRTRSPRIANVRPMDLRLNRRTRAHSGKGAGAESSSHE
jgi:hypothetical protein